MREMIFSVVRNALLTVAVVISLCWLNAQSLFDCDGTTRTLLYTAVACCIVFFGHSVRRPPKRSRRRPLRRERAASEVFVGRLAGFVIGVVSSVGMMMLLCGR